MKARLKHAYHTITKLVVKGQVPLVERQVERVDWAVKRVRDDSGSGDGDNGGIGIVAAVVEKEKTASNEVRQYALERLSDAVVNRKVTDGSVERCARIWGVVDYHGFGTEEEKEAARLKRKLKFIQLEDVLPVGGGGRGDWNTSSSVGMVAPELICSPEGLLKAFDEELGLLSTCTALDDVDADADADETKSMKKKVVVGFDADWGDDQGGDLREAR